MGETRLRVGGITDMSTIDWYGNVSLVIFFAGCNFRCPYCQNSGLIPLNSGKVITLQQLSDRIEVNRSIIDSVVFTGGEPLIQSEAMIESAKLAKLLGLKTMLDTNGSLKGAVEKTLNSGFIDRVALDVKAPLNPMEYGKVIGLQDLGNDSVESVQHCLQLCQNLGLEIEIRTTVAPGVSDDPEFIKSIASDIKGKYHVYYLQQFDNTGDVLSQTLKHEKPPSREAMTRLAQKAVAAGLSNVFIKTRSHGLERMG